MMDDGTINYWLDNAKGKDKMPEKPKVGEKPILFKDTYPTNWKYGLVGIGRCAEDYEQSEQALKQAKRDGAKAERKRIYKKLLGELDASGVYLPRHVAIAISAWLKAELEKGGR